MSVVNIAIERAAPLVEVENLVKHYPVRGGVLRRPIAWIRAVDNISFSINEGETLGLVGESGCGKTTVGRSLLRLVEPTSGTILFDGTAIISLDGSKLKRLRREMQIIFQDPIASLNPRLRVGRSIAEGLVVHGIGNSRSERKAIVHECLRRVGLEDYHASQYPYQFSGGQRQRIGIARALALQPSFIVCDEPVSALDVSVQSQVLNLLKDLQEELSLTYLFIAHDLSVIEHLCNRVAVMYLGKIVETASREKLFANPQHPYTRSLLSAIPIPDPTIRRERIVLQGDVPSPQNPPHGCRFHTRCPFVMDRCRMEEPQYKEIVKGHWAACWLLDE